jgi:hypothetical protein
MGEVADQIGFGHGKPCKAAGPARPRRQADWSALGENRGLDIWADLGEQLGFGP